ncbi:MAG: DUF5916 domain-containing protein [Vicinamibacteria bacterium]
MRPTTAFARRLRRAAHGYGPRRALAAACVGLSALQAGADTAPAAPPVAVAAESESGPTLDGDVLDDAAWSGVPAETAFWQTTPDAGAPASERTEVRILATRDALYFGIVCYDREPGRIVVNESRRDSSLDTTDSFQIILDTYRDRQNGFVFGTNPAGLEYDGQVTNQGQGGDSMSLGGFNPNWDGSWSVKTRMGEFGWSAEFEIPFRTLRYARGERQEWGLNMQRNIRRRSELAYWAPLSREHNLFRVSSAGALEKLPVPSQRNLKLTPYVLGEARRDAEAGLPRETSADAGGELKLSVTPSLTFDATVNTDFAQVEVDEQQVNLDRFSLFFPEKRPFFLENAGFFTAGTPSEVELFFSRRIGIGPNGEVIPILGGVRLSGKLAGANVGLLEMQTRSHGGAVPANNFAVARVFREFRNRSGIGLLAINRQATGDLAGGSDWNRTLGIDGRLGIGRHLDLSGYAARTVTPGEERAQHAAHFASVWRTPAWELNAKYTDVGAGFNPEVGFLRRREYRKAEGMVFHTARIESGRFGLLEARPHASYRGFWKPGGFQESGFLHVDNHLEWRSGWELHTGVNFTREGLRGPFTIYPGIAVPPGTYDNVEASFVGISNPAAPVSLQVNVTAGGFFDGSRVAVQPSLRARAGETLNAYLDWQRNDVSLAAGRFVTNLLKLRVSYSFTPRLYLQGLVQYNDTIDNWSTNLRFGWIQTANTGLFLVYNENRESESGLPLRDRSLTLKFSRLFDVLD